MKRIVRRGSGRLALAALVPLLVLACSGSGGGPAGATPPASEDAGQITNPQGDASAPPVAIGEGGIEASGDASAPPAQDSSVGPIADAPADAPAPTCGPPPARYTLLTGADAGLARDNVTALVWMQDSHGAGEPPQTEPDAVAYCTGRGMRLPTKAEALALAAGYAACAFGAWGTWTSTAAAGTGYDWVVDYTGGASPQIADNFPSAVLCVRDPAGG